MPRAQPEKGCTLVFCFAVHALLGRPPNFDFGLGVAGSSPVAPAKNDFVGTVQLGEELNALPIERFQPKLGGIF